VYRPYILLLVTLLPIEALHGTAEGEDGPERSHHPVPAVEVGASLVGFVSWEPDNPPGSPAMFRHMGTGFLATNTGWILTLEHVLASNPEGATFSVLAFIGPNKVTELPVIEGPIYQPNIDQSIGMALLKVGRVPPQLHPVAFGYNYTMAPDNTLNLTNGIYPGDEVGVYATLQEILQTFPKRVSIIRPYVRKGIVSAISYYNEMESFYFLDLVGFSGYSGGPVFRWEDGGVIGIVTSLEARQQQIEQEGSKNPVDTYWMHGVRAVPVNRCIQELLSRGEMVRFIDPNTGERFQYSYANGRQPAGK